MTDILRFLDTGVENLILVYFLLINTFYFLFNLLSLAGILRYRRLVTFVRFGEIFRMPIVKPVSVIVPAFNEGKGIVESIRSLLSLRYPVFEVIVVNDGSTDDTLARLTEAYRPAAVQGRLPEDRSDPAHPGDLPVGRPAPAHRRRQAQRKEGRRHERRAERLALPAVLRRRRRFRPGAGRPAQDRPAVPRGPRTDDRGRRHHPPEQRL